MRKRYKNSALESSQQSIFFYTDEEMRRDPVLASRPNYFAELYPHMLMQDISLGIIPVGGRSDKEAFRISLVPANQALENSIASAISRREYERDLGGALWRFLEQCTLTVLAFTEAFYEIVFLSDPQSKHVVAFDLMPIPAKTVSRRGNKLVQYVPLSVARERNTSQHITLPPERILIFGLPQYMRTKIGPIMEALSVLSRLLLPGFALQLPDNRKPTVPFDSSINLLSRDLALADAAKMIGWNARGTFGDRTLEYYQLYRQLLFEKFKIELRVEIINTLNRGLANAGKVMGFEAQIAVDGLPTLADIENAQAHLVAGDQPFKQIMDKF